MTEYNKLVRGRIPEIINRNGATAITRVLSDTEIIPALLAKDAEEEAEFLAADEVNRLDELADRVEVLRALIVESGYTLAQVEQAISILRQDGLVEDEILLQLTTQLIDLRRIALDMGYTLAQLEQVRIKKERERGDFYERIFLISTEE